MVIAGFHPMHPGLPRHAIAPAAARIAFPRIRLFSPAAAQHRVQSRADTIAR
jgi:hypothetical protein